MSVTAPPVKAGLVKDYPAIALSTAGAVVAYVLALLVTRGDITSTQASAATQQITPIVAAVLVYLIGHVITPLVTPTHRVAATIETEVRSRLAAAIAPEPPTVTITTSAVTSTPVSPVVLPPPLSPVNTVDQNPVQL